MPSHHPIRVYIADDHILVRNGIKMALDIPDISIAGEAADGPTLQEQLLRSHTGVDVLLLDLHMPNFEPIAFLRALSAIRPDVYVLAITGAPNARTIESLIRQGLRGCVLKSATSELIEPIRIVASGQYFISLETQQLLFSHQQRNECSVDLPVELSERDRQLLLMLARGDTNDEIAQYFNITRATTNNYISRLYSALGLLNRSQATNWAIRYGLLGIDDMES